MGRPLEILLHTTFLNFSDKEDSLYYLLTSILKMLQWYMIVLKGRECDHALPTMLN